MICFSVFKGLAIKCIVNGDYSEKGNPKQSDPYEEKIVECPNEITHCANITGKIAEGDLDHLPKFLELLVSTTLMKYFKQSSHLNMHICMNRFLHESSNFFLS